MTSVTLTTITQRYAFLRLRDKGQKQVTRYVILQAFDRADDGCALYGLTASKKIGNAVRRNRARRRLRALVRVHLAPVAQQGWDYGLIARYDMADAPFDKVQAAFIAATKAIHSQAVLR